MHHLDITNAKAKAVAAAVAAKSSAAEKGPTSVDDVKTKGAVTSRTGFKQVDFVVEKKFVDRHFDCFETLQVESLVGVVKAAVLNWGEQTSPWGASIYIQRARATYALYNMESFWKTFTAYLKLGGPWNKEHLFEGGAVEKRLKNHWVEDFDCGADSFTFNSRHFRSSAVASKHGQWRQFAFGRELQRPEFILRSSDRWGTGRSFLFKRKLIISHVLLHTAAISLPCDVSPQASVALAINAVNISVESHFA